MRNKKIYLLDRNVISLIKESNNHRRQTDNNKINMLSRLRKIDRKTSFISPILSIIEGQTGSAESPEKIKKTIEVEASALKKFFNKARVDSDFLKINKNHMSEIFYDSDNRYKKKYDSFLSESNSLLIDKPKKEKKKNVRDKLIENAQKYDVPIGHPIFFCCISALYGYIPAQKIIKPKKVGYNPYNARSDLLVISWLNSIEAAGIRTNLSQHVIKNEFVTMDIPLQKFLSEITVTNIKSIYGGVESRISYSKNLFPDLDQAEYLKLQDDLK